MSEPNKAPRITQELLDYLEATFPQTALITSATTLTDLGVIQGCVSVVEHLRYVKEQQEKEGFFDVS